MCECYPYLAVVPAMTALTAATHVPDFQYWPRERWSRVRKIATMGGRSHRGSKNTEERRKRKSSARARARRRARTGAEKDSAMPREKVREQN
jgi:hypothetical protein